MSRLHCIVCVQSAGVEESSSGSPDAFGCAVPDAGQQQWPELREDQPQPLESALPPTAAQPHALRVQGQEALQYPYANLLHILV